MAPLFAFQDFELDEARFELRRSGRRVAVQPKVLKLMLHLVAHRDRSVSVRELLATLWPGEVVGPASVKRAVQGARAALGGAGAGASGIRSVRAYGYQFVLAVRELRPPSTTLASLPAPGEAATDTFVGRGGVLVALDATLHEVLSGRGASVLLVGEPGIGKTRTLQELARRASASGFLSCVGRCSEVDGAPALWPVKQILRHFMKHIGAPELRALLGAGAADIAQAIPELVPYLGEPPRAPDIDSVAARFRFFDSIASFLLRASERQPIAILIDDLLRADEPTLALLTFLAREIESSRVLIAMTTRPTRTSVNVGALSKRAIELQGLRRSEVGDFLHRRLRCAPPERVVEWIARRTGGNPLFLEQVLQDAPAPCELCAPPSSASDAGGVISEPCWHRFMRDTPGQGLRAAVDRHLGLLGDTCRSMLRAAAVLGRELSLDVLRDVWEPPDGRIDLLHQAVHEAASAGILRPRSSRIHGYRFAHVLIREALYEQLSLTERARLHWRAGLALEARGAGESDALLSELAEHFAIAAAAHDRARALHYARRAADAARRCLAYEVAAKHLGRFLEVLDGSAEPALRMRVLLEQGEMHTLSRRARAARACLLHAASVARKLGAHRELARAAALLAGAPETGSVDQVHVDLLKEALAALPRSDRERPCLQALLAKSLMYSRDPEGSAQLALDARAAADTISSPAVRAEALEACHDALAAPSHLTERLAISEALTRIGHETGDQRILLRAATFRIWNCMELGDMAGVDAATASLETLVEHARDPFFRWYARGYRSARAMIAGRLQDAERLAHEAHDLGRAIGEIAGAYHAYCVNMYGVLKLQGRVREAEALVRDISLRHPALNGWRAILAQLEAELGRRDIARAVLDSLLERDLDSPRRDPFMLSALAPAAELCVAVGREEQARPLYAAMLPYEQLHANVSVGIGTFGPVARHLGLLALRMGELKCAEQHLEHAVEAAQRMASPTFIALTCFTQVHALLLGGEPSARPRATDLLARAFALARKHGMHALEQQCRAAAEHASLSLIQRDHSETIGRPALEQRFTRDHRR